MKIETKYDIGNTVLVERRWTHPSMYWDWNKEEYTQDGHELCEGTIHEISIREHLILYHVLFPKWYPDGFSSHECWIVEEYITRVAHKTG